MNAVCLSDFARTRDGLCSMLRAVIGEHGYEMALVEVPIALLTIELAKRAADRPEWFPHGKWATIQHMQARVAAELDRAILGATTVRCRGCGRSVRASDVYDSIDFSPRIGRSAARLLRVRVHAVDDPDPQECGPVDAVTTTTAAGG